MLVCMSSLFILIPVYAENSETGYIEYDITYEYITGEEFSVESEYTVQNGYGTEKSIVLISALYQDKKLLNIKTKELTIGALNTESDSITMEIPEESGDCYIKLLVWEDMQTLKPLGYWKNINDLDSYSREKFLYIDAESQEEINIYMNAVTTKGLSNETIHTISFDTSKLSLVDLCSMTYEKELSEGIINNTGITVESVDTIIHRR